jgi:hypothetical protein
MVQFAPNRVAWSDDAQPPKSGEPGPTPEPARPPQPPELLPPAETPERLTPEETPERLPPERTPDPDTETATRARPSIMMPG